MPGLRVTRREATLPPGFSIREATRGDETTLYGLIRKLAEFEKLLHRVESTPEGLAADFFERRRVNGLLVECDAERVEGRAAPAKKAVAFASWYYTYSTFAGRPGLFVEDIFVDGEYRGHGIATAIFAWLESRAIKEGCSRLEWQVLGWNAKAKAFYESRGGKALSDWETYRKPL